MAGAPLHWLGITGVVGWFCLSDDSKLELQGSAVEPAVLPLCLLALGVLGRSACSKNIKGQFVHLHGVTAPHIGGGWG